MSISYNPSQRTYGVEWCKVVENVADEPLQCVYGRINVCTFPDDLALARVHYRCNPIDLKMLNFQAYDPQGDELRVSIINEHDSNIEMNVLFQDSRTGLSFAIQPGEQKEVSYCINISDQHWGPFLERHCRVPTDELSIKLSFPPGLVKIGGQICHGTGLIQPLSPPLEKQGNHPLDTYSWKLSLPRLHSRYRFHWLFSDEREIATKRNTLAYLASENPYLARELSVIDRSTDFRSVRWYGDSYSLTPFEAIVVELLWKAMERGTPDVSQHTLLEALRTVTGSKAQRLMDLFRRSDAWGTLIVKGTTKGTYRLNVPNHSRR
jgi:hypothetical protein